MNIESQQGPKLASSERIPYAGNIFTLKDINPDGKRVVVRVDLDFKPGEHKTSRRFFAVEPTVKYLEESGAKTITLLAHNGEKSSLKYLVSDLSNLLKEEVGFITEEKSNCDGKRVILHENTRFNPGEEANDSSYASYLASLGEIYVGNAFATSHRAHASTFGVPSLMKEKAAGLQMEKEVKMIDELLSRPKDGFVAVIGGAKIKTKLPVINYLSKITETVLVGGKIAEEAKKENIIFPENVIVAKLDSSCGNRDIDLESAKKFAKIISESKTVVWNGAMGVFEEPGTEQGTLIVANAMAQARLNDGIILLAGGGETEGFLEEKGISDFYNVSIGGGAMLEYVSGKKMAALEVLRK